MGIQGMTNWKFSAFLAIALMLVAGMVSTAIAADGDGSITVGWAIDGAPGTAKATPQDAPSAATATTIPLPSGSTENEVIFRYKVEGGTAGNNMQDGAVRLVIPSGWTVSKGLVTVADSSGDSYANADIIYDTEPDGKVDGTTRDNDNDTDDNADGNQVQRDRVTILPKSGKTVSTIEVKLTGTDWNVAANATRYLTIHFSLVTAAIPSQLPYKNTANPARSYQEYRFTTSFQEEGRASDAAETPAGPPRHRSGRKRCQSTTVCLGR